jgi:acetyl esterase/lipase
MRRGHRSVVALCALAVVGVAHLGAALAAEKAGVDVKSDITYATVAGEELKLDLAEPKGLDHAAPAIVMIHGGGWSAGKRQDMAGLMKEAAARGFVSATVSYRLAPKHRFPAQIEDVKCAIRYLRAHADELKIDPKRIGAMGISAGAHLSMMLGTLDSSDGMEGDGGNPEQPSKVQAVVSFVGPTNLVWPQYTDVQVQILDAFLNGKPMDNQEACRKASPITYVNAGDAPTLMFFGTKDPLIDVGNAMQMCEALTKAGVPGRCELLLGASHGWGGAEMQRTIDAAFDFLGQQLKQ